MMPPGQNSMNQASPSDYMDGRSEDSGALAKVNSSFTERQIHGYLGLVGVVIGATFFISSMYGYVLAMWIMSAFWFACVMGPCVTPGPLKSLLWMMMIFTGMVLWFRGYLTACREEWKFKYRKANGLDLNSTIVDAAKAAKTINKESQTLLAELEHGGAVSPELEKANLRAFEADAEKAGQASLLGLLWQGHETPPIDNRKLARYCNRSTDGNKPVIYPFGNPKVESALKQHVFQVTCHRWTCTFTEQHTSITWILVLALLGAVLLNVFHASCTPNCSGMACFSWCACGCGEEFNDCCMLGRCRLWWIWVWVWLLPMWVVTYVTLVKHFDFNDLWDMSVEFFNVALQDTQQIILISAGLIGVVIIYCARDQILAMFGLDDRNIVHYLNLQGGDSRLRPFQVCVWRVCSSQRTEFRTGHITDETTGRTEDYSFTQLFSREENTLPNQGQSCNMFVRLAFGDNEPQTSRIVRMDRAMRSNTVVPFRETFSMELVDDPETDTPLHVEVRDQSVVGATELGRVTLKLGDIKDAIANSHKQVQENMARDVGFTLKTKQDWMRRGAGSMFSRVDMKDQQQAQALEVAEEQVLWLLSKEVQNASPEKAKSLMDQVGFRPYRLSKGGTIWLAFAWLNDT